MPIGKKLFEQVKDFAYGTTPRLSKIEQELALRKLRFSSENRGSAEKLDTVIRDSGVLDDPNVSRAYTFGPHAAGKDVEDTQMLIRGKDPQSSIKVSNTYSDYEEARQLNPDEVSVDFLAPGIAARRGPGELFSKQRYNKEAFGVAKQFAEHDAEQYGPDHRWIRLVAIPAAVGLGLMNSEEAEAGFKPLEVARTATGLIKANAPKILGEATPDTAKRVYGTIEGLAKIPASEYNQFNKVFLSYLGGRRGAAAADAANPRYSGIALDPLRVVPTTPVHEAIHLRQFRKPGVRNFLESLQDNVEKWIKDPWERYYNDPKEVHARGGAEALQKMGIEEANGSFDMIYNQELHKAIQYTEKWLQHMDPTFRARFIKNIAVGGAVMTALSVGPSEKDADAMPRGVYEKTAEVVGKASSTVKNLVGKTLDEGKVVKDIRKGEGSARTIFFEDGTHSTVNSSDLNKLERSFGTQKYIEKFKQGDEVSQLTQALKSMNMHEVSAKRLPTGTGAHETLLRGYVEQYINDLEEMGKQLPPEIVFVKRNTPDGELLYTLPKAYADLLEDQGVLEIVRSKKYIDIIKRNRIK